MGLNPIPEPTGSVNAAVQLSKIQDDLRQIAGGSVSPVAKAELFKDAKARLQALQGDKAVPQGIRDAIPGVLKDLARGSVSAIDGAMKTLAKLGPNITPIQPDGGNKHPVSPGPFPDPLPGNLGPGGTEDPRLGPGGIEPIIGPGGIEPIIGPGGTEDPRVGPGGLPPKR